MAVKIVTDSTSDISLKQAERLGVEVLPLRVIFGDAEYIDGVTLTAAQFYEKLAQSDVLPHTSQITPMEFARGDLSGGFKARDLRPGHAGAHRRIPAG